MAALDITSLRRRATTVWSGFTSGQKTTLALAVAAVLLGGYFFTKWAAEPTWTPLYGNLSATDAGSVTSELAGKGVSYKLADGGATVLVPQTQVYQLRLDMSAKGLPTGGSQGYALLDKQGITTSEFRQRVDYQRALEGELSRTIGAIDGVAAADVHLVIPADDVFADDSSQPSASVLLRPTTQGKKFGSDQVRAIVNLVAGSVEGLTPEAVTVADSAGHVLSAPGEGGLDASGDAQASQARTFEDGLARSIEEMLAPVTGAGGAVVRVRADLDFDERATTIERFDQPAAGQTAPIVNESTATETFTGPGASAAAGGVLGTNGQPAAGAAATGNNYEKDQAERSFAVGKVTEQVKSAPGKVSRLSVAVLLDDKVQVPAAEITNLVNAAAGIDNGRGDVVSVAAMAFDRSADEAAAQEEKNAEAAQSKAQLMNLVRTGGVLLIVLVALFLAWGSARRAGVTRQPVPGVLSAGPVPAEALHAALAAFGAGNTVPSAGPAVPGLDAPGAAAPRGLAGGTRSNGEPAALPMAAPVVNEELAELIDRQPDEVASILRGWLADRRA
jgi:flagellar M-ring protein FliF